MRKYDNGIIVHMIKGYHDGYYCDYRVLYEYKGERYWYIYTAPVRGCGMNYIGAARFDGTDEDFDAILKDWKLEHVIKDFCDEKFLNRVLDSALEEMMLAVLYFDKHPEEEDITMYEGDDGFYAEETKEWSEFLKDTR